MKAAAVGNPIETTLTPGVENIKGLAVWGCRVTERFSPEGYVNGVMKVCTEINAMEYASQSQKEIAVPEGTPSWIRNIGPVASSSVESASIHLKNGILPKIKA